MGRIPRCECGHTRSDHVATTTFNVGEIVYHSCLNRSDKGNDTYCGCVQYLSCRGMLKEIPYAISRMGRAWHLINQSHHETPTKRGKQKMARSILRDLLNKDGYIIFEGHVIISARCIDEDKWCSIDMIKATIHHNIGEYFSMELHRAMRSFEGNRHTASWEDIVEAYKSGKYKRLRGYDV